jgi:3-phenylpropionate/cinnamic acid dioxygenase small subunit
MDLQERIAITEMLGLYGHLVDDRGWDRLGEVFDPEVVYDFRQFGGPLCHGTAEVATFFAAVPHPLAHHVTNVVITPTGPDAASARSKFLCPRADGSIGTGEYVDELRRADGSWRVTRRAAVLRSERPAHLREPRGDGRGGAA